MPYINQSRRNELDPIVQKLRDQLARMEADNFDGKNNTEGNINYFVTKLFKQIYGESISYKTINDAIGVLECIKMEFYRRGAAPYEDLKISENGDVE